MSPWTPPGGGGTDPLAYIPVQRQALRVGVSHWSGPPTCWYLKSLADPTRVTMHPTQVTTQETGSRWACTFHVFCVNFTRVGYPTRTRFLVEYGLLSLGTNCSTPFLTKDSLWFCHLQIYSLLFSWIPKNSSLKSMLSGEFPVLHYYILQSYCFERFQEQI